jgi:hypothetical protein
MKLSFDLAGTPMQFERSTWTGTARLRIGDEIVGLQSPFRPSTHFNIHTEQVWRHQAAEHTIEIRKVRPRFFGGFRPNSFTISVDGTIVAEATGF